MQSASIDALPKPRMDPSPKPRQDKSSVDDSLSKFIVNSLVAAVIMILILQQNYLLKMMKFIWKRKTSHPIRKNKRLMASKLVEGCTRICWLFLQKRKQRT